MHSKEEHYMSKTLLAIVALACLAASMPAHAAVITINANQFTNGLNNQTINDITWTSSSGNFQKKTVSGWTGVGISLVEPPEKLTFRSS